MKARQWLGNAALAMSSAACSSSPTLPEDGIGRFGPFGPPDAAMDGGADAATVSDAPGSVPADVAEPVPIDAGPDAKGGVCTCFKADGSTWWNLVSGSFCPLKDATTGAIVGAVSSFVLAAPDGTLQAWCPADGRKSSRSWTPTNAKLNCTGHFKFCFTIKAGDALAPKATDCVLTRVCAENDYRVPNVIQSWGDLPSWETRDAACMLAFTKGGYAEASSEEPGGACNGVFAKVSFHR